MQPKKSLGQNFLRDKAVLDKIIQAAELGADDFVIEVGPGEGVLTEKLVKCARKVVAIEIDSELDKKLQNKFKNIKNLEVINADILEINLPELIKVETQHRCVLEDTKTKTRPTDTKTQQCCVSTNNTDYSYKVIANIPYYITSPIIRLFLETAYPPAEMILMVQKEVAKRICAKAGKLSILALSVQYYADAKLLFTVPKTAFFPVPEVDSAVIRIIRRSEEPACSASWRIRADKKEKAQKFFKLVKAGFSAKRKTLVNNLSSSLKVEKSIVEEKLKQIGIAPNQRAQELSLENWKNLVKLL